MGSDRRLAHSPVEGIVHRYHDRVLLKVVHVCPVYCRFCFRREMVGPEGLGTLSAADIEKAITYISEHPEIWEVILTGGDPMVLSPRRLRAVMVQLAAIPHVKIVRLHSRVPVVDPDHIDVALIDALKASGKTVYVAIHANHVRELTPAAESAIARLADSGIVLLSQTVLLRSINDDAEVLAALMRRFVELRIKPYYLHHPDLAPGTAHFRLSLARGARSWTRCATECPVCAFLLTFWMCPEASERCRHQRRRSGMAVTELMKSVTERAFCTPTLRRQGRKAEAGPQGRPAKMSL